MVRRCHVKPIHFSPINNIHQRHLSQSSDTAIPPLIDASSDLLTFPAELSFAVGLSGILGYGMREYVSRKITYCPTKEFITTWKSLLRDVEHQEIEFDNIIVV